MTFMDAMRRMRILKQHLKTDRLLGVSAVPLGDTAAAATLARPEPGTAATTGTSLPVLNRDQKVQALAQMDEQEVRGCTACVLYENRIQTVFGEGDPDASVMFVGEGPGQNEDEQGRPFVGLSLIHI